MAEEKKLVKGLFNWTFLVIVAVALVLINIISAFVYQRFDMTEDQRFSLANGTIEFLENKENLKNRLTMKIYLEGKLPSELKHFRNAIEDKLKEFKEYAGDRIEYQFIDPNSGTESENQELHEQLYGKGKGILPMDIIYQKDAETSQIMVWPGAILTYEGEERGTVQFLPGTQPGNPNNLEAIGEQLQNSINNLEYILISSIRRAVQSEVKSIAFLQGHGELSFAETQRARALIKPYFNVDDVTINGNIDALNNVDGLVIARPMTKFSDKDLFVIDQFLLRGGRLMCFMDALYLPEDTLERKGMTHTSRINTGLERMLFDYGLKLNENYVIDARCAPKPVPFAGQSMIPWFFHVLATPTSHPISRNVEPVSLEFVSEIQFIESETIALTPILTSSPNSTVTGLAPMVSLGLPLNYGNNPELVNDPKNEQNKRCLAGVAEGYFQSHFKNRIVETYTNSPDAKYIDSSRAEGKVILIGNGDWIKNSYDSMPNKMTGQMMYRPTAMNELRMDPDLAKMNIPLFFGNQEFFQNMTDYIMGDNSVLDIRSRQIDIHEIDKAKVNEFASFYKLLNVALPSFLVLLFAFIMMFVRKRKYAKS